MGGGALGGAESQCVRLPRLSRLATAASDSRQLDALRAGRAYCENDSPLERGGATWAVRGTSAASCL